MKRAASASTATCQACSAVTASPATSLERGADEFVVVEEEHVGVEDLGFAFSGGASDVISGRGELGPGGFDGGVEPLGLGGRCAGIRVVWFVVDVGE